MSDSGQPVSTWAAGDGDAALDATRTDLPREPLASQRPGQARASGGSLQGGEGGGKPRELPVTEAERYVFAGEHARGGLGRVVRAEDQRLSRTVAIKELLKSTAFAEALFVREALITARLQHPGIVPVHDAGRWPSGEPYYVMKLVSGNSLRAVIQERTTMAGRLGLLPDVIAVAETIAYAHSEGVIHRDIKPANVIVGEFGETVVVDWGLAADRRRVQALRSAEAAAEERMEAVVQAALGATIMAGDSDAGEHSVSGKVIGTPAYMSPEQASGAEVDERSDIYALGALLYEVLTGAPPYGGKDPRVTLELVLAGPPPAIEDIEPGVPPDLITIVRKAMARDPARRYASAKQLAEELRRFQTGQLVVAHDYSPLALLYRFLARHRSAVTVAGVGVAIMAVMGALGVRQIVEQRNHAQGERAQARLAQRAAEDREKQLILLHAKSSIPHDPTEAMAWLKRAPMEGAAFTRVRALADEAVAAGVARHVLVHGKHVFSVALSADATWVATVSQDHTIRTWDVATGQGRVIGTHADTVMVLVAISPDGRLVATAGARGDILLRTRDGELVHELVGAGGMPVDLRFSSDGRELMLRTDTRHEIFRIDTLRRDEVRFLEPDDASPVQRTTSLDGRLVLTAADQRLILSDRATGAVLSDVALPGPVRFMRMHGESKRAILIAPDDTVSVVDLDSGEAHVMGRQTSPLVWIAFAPGGRHAVTTGNLQGDLYLWDLEARAGRVLRGHEDTVFDAAFTADGSTLVTVSDDSTGRVWNLQTGQVRVLRGHSDDVYRLAMSEDGKSVVTASRDGTARVWLIPETQVLSGPPTPVGQLLLTSTGEVLSRGYGVDLRLWNLATGESRPLGSVPGKFHPRMFPAATPDGRIVAAIDRQDIVLWDLGAGTSRRLRKHAAPVSLVAISATGAHLASVDAKNRLLLWDLGASPVTHGLDIAKTTQLGFSPDGARLVIQAADMVQIRSVPGWEIELELTLPTSNKRAWTPDIAFSPGGEWLALQSRDADLVLWNLTSGEVRTIDMEGLHIASIAFSPDGAHVAAAAADRAIHIWSVAGGPPRLLVGHEDISYAIVYSPDGSLLASSSHDHTVRIWEADTGRSRVLRGHTAAVESLVFSPLGDTLISSSSDGTLRVWSVGTDPVHTAAELRALIERSTTAIIGDDDRPGTPQAR